jgi:hypothetical protein
MITSMLRAVALALITLAAVAPAYAATTKPLRPLPTPRLPTTRLHTEFVVEVNKKGQVVRVKSGKSCPNLTFNAQTYGNVLQIWIRKPNGTAIVGLYRVVYDYNPQNQHVQRHVALVRTGGDWGNKEGAANQMLDIDRREAKKFQAQQQHQHSLPSLNKITGSTPKPKPTRH